MPASLVQYLGTGRRKTAVARIFLRPGKGAITVNGKTFDSYFTTETARAVVRQPLLATETADKFDVLILANGGGFTVLHHFTSVDAVTRTNTDGAKPVANLLLAGGTLYGTAPAGGSGTGGAIFSVSTNGSQFQTLYNFSAVNSSNGTNADGAIPDGDLVLVGTSLYGTTFAGGFGAAGTVFSLTLPAVITQIVHNPNGSVTLSFLGGPGSTNVIQATTVLGPSALWQNISTNKADTGGFWPFTDSTANLFPSQFYRSYSQ